MHEGGMLDMIPDPCHKSDLLSYNSSVACRLVILDADDSWATELVDEGIVEKFYVTDLSDQDTVFENCMAGIRRAERVGLQPFIAGHSCDTLHDAVMLIYLDGCVSCMILIHCHLNDMPSEICTFHSASVDVNSWTCVIAMQKGRKAGA